MKVELHLLQNFPPSNLNRDDTGAPKDCDFGGVRRARISSQCLKRAIRTSPVFERTLAKKTADRTKLVANRTKLVAKEIADRLFDEEDERHVLARTAAGVVLKLILKKEKSPVNAEGKLSVLYFIGSDELAELTEIVKGKFDDVQTDMDKLIAARDEAAAATAEKEKAEDEAAKKKATEREKAAEKAAAEAEKEISTVFDKPAKQFVKDYAGHTKDVSIALFGRMLAGEPKLNIDAACQVAHAISTNRLVAEFDYYTAVDDLQPGDEPGAGMIGTVGYNSSCYYRYTLLDVRQLAWNFSPGNDPDAEPTAEAWSLAREGVEAFLRAVAAAIPSGKQNSTAPQTPPFFALAVVHEEGMPMSLVNAFEQPARPYRNGHDEVSLRQGSVRGLAQHRKALLGMYPQESIYAGFVLQQDAGGADAFAEQHLSHESSYDALVESVIQHVNGSA